MTETVPQPAYYRFDAAASKFAVQAFAEGLFSVFGHDPVIRIKDFQGDIEFVPGTFANASLRLVINVNSLTVVNIVKESDRQEIERTMHNEVLETRKYPEIIFQSSNVSVSPSGKDRYRAQVIGDLTLHGVTQNNIRINGEVTETPEGLRVKGNFSVKQTDFKIKIVSVAGGTLKIRNELKCSFDILVRQS